MANTTYCPFTYSLCTECILYRGRHHYLAFSKHQQDRKNCPDEPKKHDSLDFRVFEKSIEPWACKDGQIKDEPKMRLKVIDVEDQITRICEFNEAKTWNWSNPAPLRLIDGRQVSSLECLTEILNDKAEKGYQEVEICEAPRFMLLAGG
jgi:hypothetical protein